MISATLTLTLTPDPGPWGVPCAGAWDGAPSPLLRDDRGGRRRLHLQRGRRRPRLPQRSNQGPGAPTGLKFWRDGEQAVDSIEIVAVLF